MLLAVLEILILHFINTEGQIAWNPETKEYSPHYMPNSSAGSERNRSPFSKNSEQGNDFWQNQRHPTDIASNINYPAVENSNYNNPIYDANNKSPPNYNSNNNNRNYDYSNTWHAANNSGGNPPNFFNRNNYQPSYSNRDNYNPSYFNPDTYRPSAWDNSNNNPVYNDANIRNSPNYGSNYNNPNNNSPNYDTLNRRYAAYNAGGNPNNYGPPYSNPDNYRPPYSNSNNNYPDRFFPNNNRNVPFERYEEPRNSYQDHTNFSNDGYSGKDFQEGQTTRDTSYNHQTNISPNNYNSYDNKVPKNSSLANNRAQNEEQNFPNYIYYQTDPLKRGRIICLFTATKFLKSGFDPTMIPAHLCTIVNYEFAILNPRTYEINSGHPDLDYGQEFYNKTVGMKHFNPYLKVVLSLGGWMDSTRKYSDLVASPKRVNNFIRKAVKFLKDHKFDGLDIAWEYPNCWQGALGVSPQDKPNFAKFLQKVRKVFDRENLLLTISVSSIKREIKQGYDSPTIAKAVHFINVMTYDMHGPWEHKTGHHSQFGERANDTDPTLNSKAAMEYWASTGVPKEKLNMGLPTYGTSFTLRNATKHGLGAPTKGPGKAGALSHNAGTLSYREICQYLKAGNWTQEEDKDAGFYAYCYDQWVGYDHPRMVVKKARWIADNGYGGLLIKDVSGDDYEQKCFAKKFPLIWIAGMEFTFRLS